MLINTYRIITNHGSIDFAATIEKAMEKYRKYVNDMREGYSHFVKLISVNTETGAEETILMENREK